MSIVSDRILDYDTLLEEFSEGHGDAVKDEHRFFLSTDRW